MTKFCLEAGINHFGSTEEANKILNYYLNSKFDKLTFMLHTDKFYKNQKKKNINFILSKKFYEKAIRRCHAKNKKIGIAICSLKTFKDLINLRFDFYKLLSVAIDNYDLIKSLKKENPFLFL